MRCRRYTAGQSLDFDDHPFAVEQLGRSLRALRRDGVFLDEVIIDDRGRAHVRLLRHRLLRGAAGRRAAGATAVARMTSPIEPPLLAVAGLGKSFGARVACRDVDFELLPGEVLGVVGESGSGKTTLLNCLSARLEPERRRGRLPHARRRDRATCLDSPRPSGGC